MEGERREKAEYAKKRNRLSGQREGEGGEQIDM